MKASRYTGKDKKTNRRSPSSGIKPLSPPFGPPSLPLAPSLPSLCRSLLTPRLLPPTPTANGTNNGVKFIRLHIGTIKRQTDRQPSERAGRQRGSTKEGLILNIIYLCRRKKRRWSREGSITENPKRLISYVLIGTQYNLALPRKPRYMYLFRMKKDVEGSSNLNCRSERVVRNFRQRERL